MASRQTNQHANAKVVSVAGECVWEGVVADGITIAWFASIVGCAVDLHPSCTVDLIYDGRQLAGQEVVSKILEKSDLPFTAAVVHLTGDIALTRFESHMQKCLALEPQWKRLKQGTPEKVSTFVKKAILPQLGVALRLDELVLSRLNISSELPMDLQEHAAALAASEAPTEEMIRDFVEDLIANCPEEEAGTRRLAAWPRGALGKVHLAAGVVIVARLCETTQCGELLANETVDVATADMLLMKNPDFPLIRRDLRELGLLQQMPLASDHPGKLYVSGEGLRRAVDSLSKA